MDSIAISPKHQLSSVVRKNTLKLSICHLRGKFSWDLWVNSGGFSNSMDWFKGKKIQEPSIVFIFHGKIQDFL
jgi:hypothetical protein